MRIIIDDPKRAANLLKHLIDLADFEDGFDVDSAVVFPTKSSRTGRRRLKLIGEMVGHGVVTVIVSPLGSEAVSVISIRPASEKERTDNGF